MCELYFAYVVYIIVLPYVAVLKHSLSKFTHGYIYRILYIIFFFFFWQIILCLLLYLLITICMYLMYVSNLYLCTYGIYVVK